MTVLVPMHNEEEFISAKLANLMETDYPREKIEVIVIDDGSTDDSILIVRDFIREKPDFSIRLIKQSPNKGKATALNIGLKNASHDVVVTTDADSIWPTDTLKKVVPYLADPNLGAITGFSKLRQSQKSWVAKGEKSYLGLMSLVRLGESKIHSTLRFEGCLALFKRDAFDEFDWQSGADDSGTALKVIQNNRRAIFIPEAYMYADVPNSYRKKLTIKKRRAIHLMGLWFNCLGLMFKGRLRLPKKIAIPEIMLFVLNPILFMGIIVSTIALVFANPIAILPLGILVLAMLLPSLRSYFLEGILDQFILFNAILFCARKGKITKWK